MPRIVVGDNNPIGKARRNLAHKRPFALVAIAAAAENDSQLAAMFRRMRTHSLQHIFQRVRLVRVIHEHCAAFFGVSSQLQAPRHAADFAKRRDGFGFLFAIREHHAQGAQCIPGLKRADNRQQNFMFFAEHFECQLLAGGRGFGCDQAKVFAGLAVRDDFQSTRFGALRPACRYSRISAFSTAVVPDSITSLNSRSLAAR